jgi:hypothetical protein
MKLKEIQKEIDGKREIIVAEIKKTGTNATARKVGCRASYISRVSNGYVTFRLDSMINIAEKLGMDI